MASLKIKNETVYVIYHNGAPYQSSGRKLVYTTKGAAKGVITEVSCDKARYRFGFTDGKINGKDWYDLSRDSRDELVNDVRKEFEVVEYVPKKVTG